VGGKTPLDLLKGDDVCIEMVDYRRDPRRVPLTVHSDGAMNVAGRDEGAVGCWEHRPNIDPKRRAKTCVVHRMVAVASIGD